VTTAETERMPFYLRCFLSTVQLGALRTGSGDQGRQHEVCCLALDFEV
jgi:hypothetical protein